MSFHTDTQRDVMQVCRNGHVITDRLRNDPQSARSHCERCGASTLYCCPTCGGELPGAGDDPGLVPIGLSPAPGYCLTCGAPLPWLLKPRSTPPSLTKLEELLRRLPLTIRQLRFRRAGRPPFCVEDEGDLEDLLRALLPLHFDSVRLESRTPRYSATNRSDLVLANEGIAVTVKLARTGFGEAELFEQWQEDVAYYEGRGGCRTLVGLVYDPERRLRGWEQLEAAASRVSESLKAVMIVAEATMNEARTEYHPVPRF
jgi:hypothetical protein